MGLLCIIAFNDQHFKHICHLYRIEHDQVTFIRDANSLRGLNRNSIVIFGDEWWRGKTPEEIKLIEQMVKIHNSKRRVKQ